jgi:predicted PurR-regulated permease PerM
MLGPEANEKPGFSVAQFIRTLAAFAIVVAALKWATPVVIPILIAAFLAMICLPAVRRLEQRRIPSVLAIGIVLTTMVVVLLLLTAVVSNSIRDFSGSIGKYEARFDEMVGSAKTWLGDLGLDVGTVRFEDYLNADQLLRMVANTAGSALSTAGEFLVILFVAIFMLLEAQGLPDKLRRAKGDADADLSQYDAALQSVYQYLSVKTWISFLTGVLVAIFLAILGIDYPVLWGLVAFLFNYIPNIGSIIAAVPAALLGLIQGGWDTMLIVVAGYVALNMIIGNVVEPRMMGQRMGISPLVVIVSLIFWNWVLGPIGMLLSVPLTTVLKIWLEHTEDGRPIAVLLGPVEAPKPA